jgi:hypothetical protein
MSNLYANGGAAGDPLTVEIDGPTAGPVSKNTSTGYSANTWHHACVVFSATNSRSVYLDGGGKATETTETGNPIVDRTGIGVVYRNTPAAYTDGRIAEAGIWNVALTDAEVAALANGVSPALIQPQSLKLYSPLIRNPSLDPLHGDLLSVGNGPLTVATHPRIIHIGIASPTKEGSTSSVPGPGPLLQVI